MVYFFGADRTEGTGAMRDLLGGKGAGLAEMTLAGIPVPPGFTVTTRVCNSFYALGGKLPEEYARQQQEVLRRLEEVQGKRLGDARDPLLVSVRSGAKFSMPGMMDTILNLGLNDESVKGLAERTGNARFTYDSYRRFLQMFGGVVLGISKNVFEQKMSEMKRDRRAGNDLDLSAEDLKQLVTEFLDLIEQRTGKPFPQDPHRQLDMARDAVFRSWFRDRAVFYRRQHGIPDDLGTAVNVQAMVYGNMGPDCATGVGFTRNPATGENEFYGEYLRNAQGEDVVAGIRTPRPILELGTEMPEVYRELREIALRLERHYRDVQDFEFTVQEGRLFMLQTRTGKRTAQAAVKIAVDLVSEGLITKDEALLRVDPTSLDQLLHPRIDPEAPCEVLARGLAASPGAAVGKVVFDPDEAVAMAQESDERGKPTRVLLVRSETSPDDIHGMAVAAGILTATGGMTSHAAVVARGMGKCCVAGCSAAEVHEEEGFLKIGEQTIKRGEYLSLNGSTGEVLAGEVPTIEPEVANEFRDFIQWADQRRRLGVRANADTPEAARIARRFGAEGIGLCRTEHMFFAEERLPHVQAVIMHAPRVKDLETRIERKRQDLENASEDQREAIEQQIAAFEAELAEPRRRYTEALDHILPFQRDDFYAIFKEMHDLPVTVRTLDPPLHEFLPRREDLRVEVALLKERKRPASEIEEREVLLERAEALSEVNPMLGHRGCRLGIAYPEITEMQVRAIFEAAARLAKEGVKVLPEIMIPLVGTVRELDHQRRIVDCIARDVAEREGIELAYLVGTMIEVPRAALTAGEIATRAEFFSFGTNDLTQMTFGFSRDDAGKFLPLYVESGILEHDPFVSLDETGVGQLVEMAVARGRSVNPELKTGICGEHGGDPRSIGFCHGVGLEYVSCSPFRVPIARLAAAQAAIRGERPTDADDHRGQI
ncbi:MAG: pyruvate, phosphate dikinase [Candidatus Eisenbacteria sp.]|nr:pyruvate, phosphate dikinase [Candidatus Eisenbacteria bacterium]